MPRMTPNKVHRRKLLALHHPRNPPGAGGGAVCDLEEGRLSKSFSEVASTSVSLSSTFSSTREDIVKENGKERLSEFYFNFLSENVKRELVNTRSQVSLLVGG